MSDDTRSCVVIMTVVSAAVIRRSVVWQTDANNQYNGIRFWGIPNRFELRIGTILENSAPTAWDFAKILGIWGSTWDLGILRVIL